MISLVTGVGAAGQVGEAVAAALAMRGDRVLVVGRDVRDATARASELAAKGLSAVGYGCDLADSRAVDGLAAQVQRDHDGRLDSLVNLAGGFGFSGPLSESDPALLQKMLQINLATAFFTTRSFLPLVREARGSIVYFASEAVLEGARSGGVSAYAAAKAGVVALMRSVADEGRVSGVRANALAPAAIRTATNEAQMGAKTKYVEREDVASAVAFLCSPEARAISGQVIHLRPAPGL